MASRRLILVAALCLLQLCLAQHRQFYQWNSPFERLPFTDRRRQLPPDGYHPEFGTCGSGTTCENACGPNWISCKASTDLSLFCYNKVDLGQSCCENESGRACDRGYYCAWNKIGGKVWCCKEGQPREECIGPEPNSTTPANPSATTRTTTTTTTTTTTSITTTTTSVAGVSVITTTTRTVTEPGSDKTVTCYVTVTAPGPAITITAYSTVTVTIDTCSHPNCPTPPHPPKPVSTPCTDPPDSSSHPGIPGYSKSHGSKLTVSENDVTKRPANITTTPSAVVTAGASNVAMSSLALAFCVAVMVLL